MVWTRRRHQEPVASYVEFQEASPLVVAFGEQHNPLIFHNDYTINVTILILVGACYHLIIYG